MSNVKKDIEATVAKMPVPENPYEEYTMDEEGTALICRGWEECSVAQRRLLSGVGYGHFLRRYSPH